MASDHDAKSGARAGLGARGWPDNVIPFSPVRARPDRPPADPAPAPGRDRRLALICAPAGQQIDLLSDWLAQIGASGVHIADRLVAPDWIAAIHSHFHFAVLDRDLIADTADLYEYFGQLRSLAPRLPLILISRRVGGDDFSLERRLMCDATLRVPITSGRFSAAIAAALRNNAAGRRR